MPAKAGDTTELDTRDEAVVYTFTDAELDEILAERSAVEVIEEGLTAIRDELRDGLQRVYEALAEQNMRLRILKDPFQSMTVAGRRLAEKDEAERKAPGARGCEGAEKAR